jgi:hypothetical protein
MLQVHVEQPQALEQQQQLSQAAAAAAVVSFQK